MSQLHTQHLISKQTENKINNTKTKYAFCGDWTQFFTAINNAIVNIDQSQIAFEMSQNQDLYDQINAIHIFWSNLLENKNFASEFKKDVHIAKGVFGNTNLKINSVKNVDLNMALQSTSSHTLGPPVSFKDIINSDFLVLGPDGFQYDPNNVQIIKNVSFIIKNTSNINIPQFFFYLDGNLMLCNGCNVKECKFSF